MDPPVDLDDAFLKEILRIVSPVPSEASTPSEFSFKSEAERSPASASVHPSTTDVPIQHATTTTVKAKPKRIRKGRKTELLELRAQIATYKTTLETLALVKHEKSVDKDGSFWQRSAHRIALEKRLAIRENARLRSLAERQLTTIKALQRSVLNIKTSTISQGSPADERTPALLDRPGQFLGSADKITKPPANAVNKTGARKLEVDVEIVNGVRSVCVELEDVHSIPFNYHYAGVHAWKYLLQTHDHERRQGIYRNFQREGDALFGVMMLDCLPDQQSIAHSQVRLWKHVEQHSVSFTWESASHECLTALDAHKRGSLRFEPSPDDPNHAAVCITSVHFAPYPLGESGVGVAMESVISAYEGTIGFLRQAVIASLHEQTTSAT